MDHHPGNQTLDFYHYNHSYHNYNHSYHHYNHSYHHYNHSYHFSNDDYTTRDYRYDISNTDKLSYYRTNFANNNDHYDTETVELVKAVNWYEDNCKRFELVLCTFVNGLLCLTGIVFNSISIVVFAKDKHNKVATLFLEALALADIIVLLIAFVVLTLVLGPYNVPSFQPCLNQLIPFLKKYANPVGYIAQCCSIWITVLLAVNRYIAVCHPFVSWKWLTIGKARLQLGVVILLSVAFNVPRFFLYDIKWKNYNNSTIPVAVITPLGQNHMFDMGYLNYFYTIVILMLPLAVLLVFNCTIGYQMKKSRRRNSCLSNNSQDRSINFILIFIVIELLVCHFMDRVLTLIKITYMDLETMACPSAMVYLIHISNTLIIINSSTDFFIYMIFRKRFRKIFRNWCCLKPAVTVSPKISFRHGLLPLSKSDI